MRAYISKTSERELLFYRLSIASFVEWRLTAVRKLCGRGGRAAEHTAHAARVGALL